MECITALLDVPRVLGEQLWCERGFRLRDEVRGVRNNGFFDERQRFETGIECTNVGVLEVQPTYGGREETGRVRGVLVVVVLHGCDAKCHSHPPQFMQHTRATEELTQVGHEVVKNVYGRA